MNRKERETLTLFPKLHLFVCSGAGLVISISALGVLFSSPMKQYLTFDLPLADAMIEWWNTLYKLSCYVSKTV